MLPNDTTLHVDISQSSTMVQIDETLQTKYDHYQRFVKGLESWKKCTLPAVVTLYNQARPDLNAVKKQLATIKASIQLNKRNDYMFVDVELERKIYWALKNTDPLIATLRPINVQMDTVRNEESQKNIT